MKKIISLLSFFILINSCNYYNGELYKDSNKPLRLKTFRNKDFSFKYPNSWVKFGAFDHIYLQPKVIKKIVPEDELNHISINKNYINADKYIGVERTLNVHGKSLSLNEKSKRHELIKLENHPLYIYKIESSVNYINLSEKYKRIEFFYIDNNNLDYVKFQMREDLFNRYEKEAMMIINSFKPKY